MDNEQYIQRTITQRNIGELHGQFCYTNKDNKGIRIKDNLIFKNSRETQPVFQKIKMWFQHGENSNPRSSCWEGTNSNGKW